MLRWLQIHAGIVSVLLGVLSLFSGLFTGGLTVSFINNYYYFSPGPFPGAIRTAEEIKIEWDDFFPPKPEPRPRQVWASIPAVPGPFPPSPEVFGEWEYQEFPCEDLTCRLFVLSQNYYWAYESRAVVLYQGEECDIYDDHLMTPGLQAQMADATDVIAVGTASCEGHRTMEATRAALRAQRLEDWLREALPDATNLASRPQLWRLNLGKFRSPEPCDPLPDNPTWEQDKTHLQRKVVFLLLDRRGTDYTDNELEDLLQRAMNEEAALDIHPRDYWEFDLERRFY